MLESDGGVFRPRGFGFSGNDRARATVQGVATLLARDPGGGGRRRPAAGRTSARACRPAQVPAMALEVDGSKYFLYHHTSAEPSTSSNRSTWRDAQLQWR